MSHKLMLGNKVFERDVSHIRVYLANLLTAVDGVGENLNKIIRFPTGTGDVTIYDKSEAGFTSALAAASAGEIIFIPAGTISGNHTIPDDVEIIGLGDENTKLSGTITNNGILTNINVTGALTIGTTGRTEYQQILTVAPAGADFTTIQGAIDSIGDASSTKRYLVQIGAGTYAEQVTMKDWVDIRGAGKHATRINYASDNGSIILSDWCQVEDLLIEGQSTATNWAIVGDNTSHWHIRNVDILNPFGSGNRSQGIKVTGSTWSTGFIERCVLNFYTQTGWGIYLTGNGQWIDATINDVFLDTYDATTGGSIYLDNVEDIQIKYCHLRTSSNGNCVEVNNSGSEVEIAFTLMEGGSASLQINAGTVQVNNCAIDSISGAWSGLRLDHDSDEIQVNNGIAYALLRPDELRLDEHSSAPATPGAGYVSVYAKADGTLYCKDDAGVEYALYNNTYILASKTGAYTSAKNNEIIICNASGGAFTITLPAASSSSGWKVTVKKIDSSSNAITIDGNGAETIDDQSTITLDTQYDAVQLVCDGTEWWIT